MQPGLKIAGMDYQYGCYTCFPRSQPSAVSHCSADSCAPSSGVVAVLEWHG
jgi:hypothetical protein